MRFLHAADVHIDSPLRGLDCYAAVRLCTAPATAWGRLLDKAQAEARGNPGACRHRAGRETRA